MKGTKLTFPSTALLPMNDVAEELKTIYKFQTTEVNASDVDKVAGVPADFIAVAYVNEDGDKIVFEDEDGQVYIEDRETVKNAMYLKGIPADEYMSRKEGAVIENLSKNISDTFADEIASLRDEIYQLRGELTRNGMVKEHGLYAGFQDFFKPSNKKYIYTHKIDPDTNESIDTFEIAKLGQSFVNAPNVNKVVLDKAGLIKEGDWFVINKTDVEEEHLVQATKVEVVGGEEEITFRSLYSDQGISSIDNPNAVQIWKVLGDYFNGTFSYSEVQSNVVTNRERLTMLNDDTKTEMQTISVNRSGYAATFRVPSNMGGAVNKFSVFTRVEGSPGALTCYVFDGTAETLALIKDVNDPAIQDRLIAKSLPITVKDSSSLAVQEINFDFTNPRTNKKPIIDGGKHLCFIIVAEAADETNRWFIQFTKANYTPGTDVQTNNNAYLYVEGNSLQESQSLGDLMFVLSTLEVATLQEVPKTEGVYSTKVIKASNNESLARARLTMRVNKEGILSAVTNGIIIDGGLVKVSSKNKHTVSDLGLQENDVIVIGDQIRTVNGKCTNSTFPIDKAMLVEAGMPVYRIGYKPYLRAVKRVWNGEKDQPGYEVLSDKVLPMELKCVMKDDMSVSDEFSERLIFECEFRDEQGLPIDANEFYLQVVWASNVSKEELNNNKDFVGRIFDLSLSFDRTL